MSNKLTQKKEPNMNNLERHQIRAFRKKYGGKPRFLIESHIQFIRALPAMAVVAIITAAYLWMSSEDLRMQECAELHKQEAIAAARLDAHKKAVAMREAGLLDEANRMMYPVAQVSGK
jgi:hypothetical protein